MISRIDYFSELCEQYNSEILHNEEAQLLLLSFSKGNLELSFIVPMPVSQREYDLEITQASKVLFSDFADLPSIGDESEKALENMFRNEISSSIKELLTMDFAIENEEIIFQQ